MTDAISIILSKQMGLFRKTEVIANNVANTSTAGFKKELVINNEFKLKNNNESTSYANDLATIIDTSSGSITKTDRPLDATIVGVGYFKINTPLGPRYTRNGQFGTDSNGTLVDGNFFPVASSDGDIITIPTGAEVNINESGQVMANDQILGEIGIFELDSDLSLQPVGGSLYKSDAEEKNSTDYKIIGGAYEGSNVSSVTEMQDLIETQRYAGVTSNIISIVEELEQNAIKSLSDSAKQ
jgi:flagellar basal-body rod protein FlgF